MLPSTISTPTSPSTAETTTEPTPAVEAAPVTVDPGQVIRVNARFPSAPDKVLFSFLPPQTDEAVHDPGAGQPETRIQREEGSDLHSYSIDTRGMRGGLGWWYFVSEDPDLAKRRAKVGRFVVRDVPRALLERDRAPIVAEVELPEPSGLDLLGAAQLLDDEPSESPRLLIGVGIGVAVGAALALL